MNVDESMEMVEREGAEGMPMGDGKGYQLGSYAPEMKMEDEEEEREDEREEARRMRGEGWG